MSDFERLTGDDADATTGSPETADRGTPDASSRLVVGRVDDPAERRADVIAERIEPVLGYPSAHVAARPTTVPISRRTPRVRRSAGTESSAPGSGPDGGRLDRETEQDIGRIRRSGVPLDEGIRSSVEQAAGGDLSGVRIHTGTDADQLSRRINASAFTVGNDIFLARSAGDPNGSGRSVLAHELGHVVDGSSRVRRFDSKTNRGRDRKHEDKILAAAKRDAAEVARRLHDLLHRKTSDSNYTTFNHVMRLLMRTGLAAIQVAYNKLDGHPTTREDMAAKFKGFRATYIIDLLNGGTGIPSPINRVRLALGVGGYGAAAVVSDQREALRLINELNPTDLTTLHTEHGAEIKTGFSKRARLQVEAKLRAAEAIGSARQAATAGPAGPHGGAPATVAVLDGAGERRLLDAYDRELGKMLSGAMKGEATTGALFDRAAVKLQFNLPQFTGELKAWLSRAEAAEQAYFGGRPSIRRYVLGLDVQLSDNDDGSANEAVKGQHFLARMKRRTGLIGWNEGDRTMIKMLISGGTASRIAVPMGSVAMTETVDAVNADRRRSREVDGLDHVERAIARCRNSRVVTALSALAAEMIIQNKPGAKSKADRAIQALVNLGPSDTDDLWVALHGELLGEDDVLSDGQRRASIAVFVAAMRTAKLKDKEIRRIGARLNEATSGDAYVAMRRYAFKKSFKPNKFDQLVAQLTPAQIRTARSDELLKNVLQNKQIARGFRRDVNPITSGQLHDNLRGVDDGFDANGWTERWNLYIISVKDRSGTLSDKSKKKIYAFALDIYDAGGNAGLVDVYQRLSGRARRLLSSMSLGQALDQGEAAMASYDLVGKVVGKSQTGRPKGTADLDTLAQAFESLHGETLLAEWTNIAECDEDDAFVERKNELIILNDLAELLEAAGRSVAQGAEQTRAGAEKRARLLEGIIDHRQKVRALNERLTGDFRLMMRDDRRQQLNTTIKHLQTSEYFDVNARFAEHLAAELNTPAMREALKVRGIMPHEFAMTADTLLFLADKSKQANLATWHQWALFTARGQLREESSALLTRYLLDLGEKVEIGADGAVIDDARQKFGEARDELASRTETFVATAKKYTQRLKKIIGLIIDAAIAAGTLGLGAIPALAQTIITVAMSFAKDVALALIDKVMMPSESNLGAEVGLSFIKNVLKGAVRFGLDQVIYLLDVQMNLVDPNASGLSGGPVVTVGPNGATTLVTSNAHAFRSPEEYGYRFLSNIVSASLSKITNKAIDTGLAAISTDGEEAWKRMITDLTLSDLADVVVMPFLDRLLVDLRKQMNLDIQSKAKAIHNGQEYTVVVDLAKKWEGTQWDWATSINDDSYGYKSALSGFSAKIGPMLAGKVQDETVFAFIDVVRELPVDQLQGKIGRARQQAGDARARSLDADPVGERIDPWAAFDTLTDALRHERDLSMLEALVLGAAMQAIVDLPELPDLPERDLFAELDDDESESLEDQQAVAVDLIG